MEAEVRVQVQVDELARLQREVAAARERYLDPLRGWSEEQGLFKPAPDAWCAAEVTEHLVHAEHGGICGMWIGLHGLHANDPPWKEEHTHRGLTIEEVVERTWPQRVQVPEGAGPSQGGPLSFWTSALEACQLMLDRLAEALAGEDLEAVVYPHPISGPLDARQRFQFLRFHIDRHAGQVQRLRQHPQFPAG
jgi:hypothetical protein